MACGNSRVCVIEQERAQMRQGFGLLDEKRILMAGEFLRLARHYETLASEAAALRRTARDALAAAVERHGIDALQVYCAGSAAPMPSLVGLARFLGAPVKTRPPWRVAPAPAPEAFDASGEADACFAAFARWPETTLETGALAANLEPLGREYRRVEQRAKALENVLLPEVEASRKRVVEQLDVMDQEEAIRVRTAGASR
jgi:V/A-type H+-transporting ATPase subunit D